MISKKLKFGSILIILLLAGFITTSLVSYFVAHDSLSSQIEETTLPLTSDNIYSEIQRDLLNPIFISSLMAQDTFVRDWMINGEVEEEAIVRYLSEIQKRYDAVTCFFVSDMTRKYYHPLGILKEVSKDDPQDEWYFRTKDLKDDYEVNVDTDTADGNSLNIFINYRVFDYSGNFIGVTGVGLAVKSVKDMIRNYQSRYGRQVYFIDRKGDITLSNSIFAQTQNIRLEDGINQIATQILTSPGYSGSYEKNGRNIHLNSRIVPEFDWYLIVEQVEDPGEERIQNTLFINIAISIIISLIVLLLANLTIGGYQKKLEEMATTDNLTGTTNRQVFDLVINQALRTTRRRKEPLSAIMFDIDNFKDVNDKYGHPAGDSVLKIFVDTVCSGIRDTDTICRWGGDEFLLLLPDCDLDQGTKIAEKIRKKVEGRLITYKEEDIAITTSLGVTQFRANDDKSTIVKRVDDALYQAKNKGRNRVEFL